MRIVSVWSAWMFLLLSIIPVNAIGQPQKARKLTAHEVASKALASVVVLITKDGSGNPIALGSGFFVGKGLIATNYHVVEDATEIWWKPLGKGHDYKQAELVGFDPDADLAVLKTQGFSGPSLQLAKRSQPGIGDQIYVVGNPEGYEGTFSQGIVSGLRGRQYLQITAPISHGSSGGPVLDGAGQVIGVAVGAISEGQNLNFAVAVTYLATLLGSINTDSRKMVDVPPYEALVKRGSDLAEKKKDKEAIEEFKKALAIKPDYADAYFYLSLSYVALDQEDEALEAIKQAIKFDPSGLHYHTQGWICRFQHRYIESIEAYKNAIRLGQNDYFSLALSYQELGLYNEALDTYKEWIKKDPDSSFANRILGDFYKLNGKTPNAIDAYRVAASVAGEDANSHYEVGNSFDDAGLYREAIEEFKKAIKYDSDNKFYHYFLGIEYIKAGDKGSALGVYKVLKDIDKEYADKLFDLIYK